MCEFEVENPLLLLQTAEKNKPTMSDGGGGFLDSHLERSTRGR